MGNWGVDERHSRVATAADEEESKPPSGGDEDDAVWARTILARSSISQMLTMVLACASDATAMTVTEDVSCARGRASACHDQTGSKDEEMAGVLHGQLTVRMQCSRAHEVGSIGAETALEECLEGNRHEWV